MRSLIKSFLFAFNGIKLCIKSERNFRIHTAVAFYVILFSLFYDFTAVEYAVLIIVIVLVIFVEMVNTAVEFTIDLESQSYNMLAKNAKDVAAGAVLVTALGAVVTGIFLFFDIEKFKEIFIFFKDRPWALVLIVLSFIPAYFYIKPKKK